MTSRSETALSPSESYSLVVVSERTGSISTFEFKAEHDRPI